MIFDSIYKNRPYLFEIGEDVFEGSEEIIHEILKHANLEISNPCISFVNSNYNYDTYKVVGEKESFCVKYSFDSNNLGIKKEFDILTLLPNDISPKAIACGKLYFGDTIHYSITSFENAEDVKSLGISNIVQNIEQFLLDWQAIQNNHVATDCFNDYLNSFLKTVNLNSFPEDSLEAISLHSNLDVIKETINSVENELLYLCSPKIVKNKWVCHGNLKASNILFKNDSFKFIDFGDCYHGSPYLDLASLIIHSGLNADIEKHIVHLFIEQNKNNNIAKEWMAYQSCRHIMIRKIFLEILITYLKEVYVFSSSRPMKILDCIDLFSKNISSFFMISAVEKHKEFIYQCLLEPIVGLPN